MGSDFLLPVYGFVVGVLVGLTGMGGGVLMTPLLVLGLGMPATAAVGTDLAYSSITKLAGAWQHWRQGTVDIRVVRALAIGSMPASVIAVAVLYWLQGHNAALVETQLQHFIGAMLVVAAFLMIRRVFFGQPTPGVSLDLGTFPTGRLIAIGALGGFMVGLTSIGSGSLIIALMVMTVALKPEVLVGTDVAHAFLLVGTAAIAHFLFLQEVQIALAAKLLIGSIPGVLIGSRLALRVPRRPLQIGLAGLLLSTAFTLFR
ncbi:MAG: sulfite exporter TauE/SafE family protein [Thermomicrobiales bacterium]|nr:sulfite exporter TauE/SafE family protein [Thermomicrobiales bacterium]